MSEVQAVDEGNNDRSSTSTARNDTELSTKYFFYTWTLNNFSECKKFSEPKIISPEFEFAGAKWRLWLQSICKNDKLDKINIRLMQSEKCDSGYYIKYKFSLLDADGSLVSKEAASLFGETHWGHRLSFKYYEKNKNGSSFIINDKVIVHCELSILASVASNDKIFSFNQFNNQVQRRLNKAMNYPSKGLMQLQSSSQMPKATNKPKPPAKTTYMNDFSRHKRFELLFVLVLSFLLIFTSQSILIGKNSTNGKLNMTEVNELIIDSTLKIQAIAEALNLTDVKIKSAELLARYHNNYNIPNGNHASARPSLNEIFYYPVLNLNASSDKHKTAINVNSTDINSDNLTEH